MGKQDFLQFSVPTSKKSESLCILTDPLPTLSVKQICVYHPVKMQLAKKFLELENIISYSFVNINIKIVGIKASKTFIDFYIPIKSNEPSSNSDTQYDIQSPSFLHFQSEMTMYTKLSSTARYLSEYIFYLYSRYYLSDATNDEDKTTPDYLEQFMVDSVEVDPTFEYGLIPRTFSLESGCFRDGKLIVPNDEIYKKLLYVLQLKIRDNFPELKNYSDYKYIQKYFVDIKDYEQSIDYMILYGQESLIKWIDNKKLDYKLTYQCNSS